MNNTIIKKGNDFEVQPITGKHNETDVISALNSLDKAFDVVIDDLRKEYEIDGIPALSFINLVEETILTIVNRFTQDNDRLKACQTALVNLARISYRNLFYPKYKDLKIDTEQERDHFANTLLDHVITRSEVKEVIRKAKILSI